MSEETYALYPLYAGEVDLKLRKGAEALEGLFDKHKVSELLDTRRTDVSSRPWWKLI